jgi:uncharacterized protein YqjF (DUF2071 family)
MDGVSTPSAEARMRLLASRGEPLFLADWLRVLMMHFEVDPRALQRDVPFPLELWNGRAFVSLVAFTFQRLRPRRFERLGGWLFKPVASHDFLNFRTYVHHNGEPGIHFVAEWLSSRLASKLGPSTFGLPYRYSRIRYDHDDAAGRFGGEVSDGAGGTILRYRGCAREREKPCACARHSLEEWLMERYTAFNCIRGKRKFFRIWHETWSQIGISTEVDSDSRIYRDWPWFREAVPCGANYSRGFRDVWMGRPHRA